MKASVQIDGKNFEADLLQPIPISISLQHGLDNPRAWYVEEVKFEPVRGEGFIGDVNQGGSVNFRNVFFNPHGHGTHTECVGHISKEPYTINQCLKKFHFLAALISLKPEAIGEDAVITEAQIQSKLEEFKGCEALIIRTLPNNDGKLNRLYSNTNPPYIHSAAVKWLDQAGIEHLLVDTPSVDREVDKGVLATHHAFWQYPHNTQTQKTISELVFVPNHVPDGKYLLNLQIAAFENDASPSKPVLYALVKK